MSEKVAVLIGTRPGIIKMSPLVHELRKKEADHIVIHSGQHYSEEMDRIIMENAGILAPDYQIRRDESWVTHAQQTAYMLMSIEEILLKEKPGVILVCGDANTNMAGALAARKIHVKVGHVEAGLRSFDWRMPEEHNRVIIDHISEYLFAPHKQAREYLLNDGVQGEIFVVGNTIVDATLLNSEKAAREKQHLINEISDGKDYVLLTLHREENVDHPGILKGILEAIAEISEEHLIVFPVHPRTRKRIDEFGLTDIISNSAGLKIIEPLGYLDFLALLMNAHVTLTDSGGLQEESCILQVPCITLRESTERKETVEIGANLLAGSRKSNILECFTKWKESSESKKKWSNPFGDGKASERIINIAIHGGENGELGE